MTAYRTSYVPCHLGKGKPGEEHAAERNPDGKTYLFAYHSGAHVSSCAAHSGLCHEDCWPAALYPLLRNRIAPREDGSGS